VARDRQVGGVGGIGGGGNQKGEDSCASGVWEPLNHQVKKIIVHREAREGECGGRGGNGEG